ncbi:MAG: S16 family serine protease [Propionicimonas sp.]|nr:S16 family serine protease [Propionicimonas sp.]
MTKQTWTAAVAALLFVALAAVIAMVPVPYVTWAAGSTYNLLGFVEADPTAKPAISIEGARTYESRGEVRMATVSVTRPDSDLTLPEALFSYWLPEREVLPREAVYPPGVNASEIQDASIRMMDDSQGTAIVAALRVAGVEVVELPMVAWVTAAGPSNGLLRPGDLITAVDNTPVERREQIQEALAKHAVGDPVKFDLERDGIALTETVTTRGSTVNPDEPSLGIGLTTGYKYDPTITFGIDPAIGGPSAGLPFAIAIYDMLTPEQLLAGRVVAATGEIDANGRVRRIGGVQEKIAAAARDGATVFLLPSANCEDAPPPPDGMRLVPVDNLGDALVALDGLDDPDLTATIPQCA